MVQAPYRLVTGLGILGLPFTRVMSHCLQARCPKNPFTEDHQDCRAQAIRALQLQQMLSTEPKHLWSVRPPSLWSVRLA